MLAAYGITIALVLVGIAGWGVVLFAIGRAPDRPFLIALALVSLELVVQALLIGLAMAFGEVDSSVPLVGYLALSLVLIPLVARPGAGDTRTRWDSATIAAVCIAVAVVVLRIASLL